MNNPLVSEVMSAIDSARRQRIAGRQKPHKLIMLLAVIDLAEDRLLDGDRLYWTDELISRFRTRFAHYAIPGDWCQPGPPFFHLRSSPFWTPIPKAGKESEYARMTTSGGGSRRIGDIIDHVRLGPALCGCLHDPVAREELRAALLARLVQRNLSSPEPEPYHFRKPSGSICHD